jgi:phosphatidylglycerol---prolipoprotein diacylglyceryl transferase
MHPRLLTTPYFVFHTFGLFLACAFLAALWQLLRGVRREGLDRERATSLGLWVIVGAILGAKLLMIVRAFPDYLRNPAELVSFATIQSAGDFYGGFIGALIASLIFFARHPEMPKWLLADLCAPAIALGQAIGRIGCFMAGDDFGKPSHAPWAVAFHDPEAAEIGGAPLGTPLHPVQIYESLICLGLFFFLVWLTRRKKFNGEIILVYSFFYAVARFFIEYLRGDVDRGFLFGELLSTSQFIAILVIIVSIPLTYMRIKKHRELSKQAG